MTKEELQRIGRDLRAMRVKRGLRQEDVANDPKLEISLGTLQAIESAWYEVKDSNIEKYARYFGTTVEKLLHPDKPKPMTASDPLLDGLNDEHLDIARRYMRARKRVRAGIELLLAEHPEEERLTRLLTQLAQLPTERLAQVDRLVVVPLSDRALAVLDRIAQRVVTDEAFVSVLEEYLNALPPQQKPKVDPQPAESQPAHHRRKTPTRSA